MIQTFSLTVNRVYMKYVYYNDSKHEGDDGADDNPGKRHKRSYDLGVSHCNIIKFLILNNNRIVL